MFTLLDIQAAVSNSVASPSGWLVMPFVVLLLCIAVGPLLFAQFWHHSYKVFSVVIGCVVAGVYLFVPGQWVFVTETLAEYVSFISLLLVLYVVSGGIYIQVDAPSKARVNMLFYIAGAVLTNIIGTTGASVLLIRPFIRVNGEHLKPYHIIFFIFFVSNLGGLLTPIGDPPLFMGFLKGVPFTWTLTNLFPMWIVTMLLLSGMFLLADKVFHKNRGRKTDTIHSNKIQITGLRNFGWLLLAVITVFLDPNIIHGFPGIELHGKHLSYIREILQLTIALIAYKTADRSALQNNVFSFEPIKEVVFLFFGIFLTMMPALQSLEYIGSQMQAGSLTPGLLYWGAGVCSSFLDNAPAYINFLAFAMSVNNYAITSPADVLMFANGSSALQLAAISCGAVFFGALTYIGNGPNFMVKSIAEHSGVKMPGFFRYIFKYAFPYLLPVLIFTWIIFFS